MAAIPTILKGDTPAAIPISLADGFDYAEATLHVRYMGVEKVFTGLAGGGVLSLQYTAEETSRFQLGAAQVGMWLVYPGGVLRTIPTDNVRIKVTDSASEVYNATIALRPATLPPDATESDTLGDLKAKYNALKATLAAGCAALCVLVSSAAGISGGPLNDIPGNATVVTNVTFDGLAKLEDLQDAGVSAEAVTNIVKAVAPKPEDYTTTNAVKDIVTDLEPIEFSEWTVTGWPSDATYKGTPYYNGFWWEIDFLREDDDIPWLSTADTDDPNATHLIFSYGISASRTVLKYKNRLGLAMADDIPDVAPLNREIARKADASTVNALSNTVTQWTTYWDGDDVRVTITNYYGSMALPSMYLEQRMPADETHDATWFKVVWNELTRWNDFLSGYASVTNELAQKADRAWGFYDSSTGEFSPDGFLQISTPNIILAKDMAYQKTVTTGGCAVWVLTATQPVALTGETEQGYFRITDGDGNALFEIVKGDKRIAGATATALTMDGGSIVIPYSVTGDNPQPTLSVCTDLAAEDWQTGDDITVAAVSWAVSDGHWTATVTPMGPRPSLFFKASYEAGGNTYIKNNVATSIDKVVIGGHEYTVTVETVNGKKLLVLQ